MKPSISNRKFVLAVAGFVVALAAACLWFFASSASAPEAALLLRRMHASISLGWGWLHAKDMRVIALEKKGEKYAVTFSYAVIIDKDEASLSPGELERFRRFLPMCSSLPIARGSACSLQEEMIFINTKEHGWMPELIIRYRPELLHAIADWKDPTP